MIVLGAVFSAFPWLLPGCLKLTGAFQEPLLQEAVRRIPHAVLHGWKGKLPGLLRPYTGTLGAAHSPSTLWGHLCCSNDGEVGGRAPVSRKPPDPRVCGRSYAIGQSDNQIQAPWLTQFRFHGSSNSPHPEVAGG